VYVVFLITPRTMLSGTALVCRCGRWQLWFYIQMVMPGYFCAFLSQTNKKYEITSDTKAQMRFLSELDSLERKRSECSERETLLRMAKVALLQFSWIKCYFF